MLKMILNQTEEVTDRLLEAACSQYGARVFAKIRMADILPIDKSGITIDQYSFALKAHFDFIVAEENYPVFAVEFDGQSHQAEAQAERDRTKDKLCDHFNLPIIRINGRYIEKVYRQMDLLSWFVHVWFLQRSFYDAQESGLVPHDEPFCAWATFLPGERTLPLFLSFEIREKISRLHESKLLLHHVPSYFIGRDANSNLRGLTWIRIDQDRWLSAKSGMRLQQFPIDQTEAFDEILVFELWGKIETYLKSRSGTIDSEQLMKQIRYHEKNYKRLWSGGVCERKADDVSD